MALQQLPCMELEEMNRPVKRAPFTRPQRPLSKAPQQLPIAPIDLAYGQDGHAHFSAGEATSVLKSKFQPSRFYVTGFYSGRNPYHPYLACLDASGKLDNTFNSSGIVDFSELSGEEYGAAEAVAEDMTGNLLVAVQAYALPTTYLWKLTPNGEPDTSFGYGKGYVDTRALFGEQLMLEDLVCFADMVLATGWRSEGGQIKSAIVALTREGGKFGPFGKDGMLSLSTLIPDNSAYILDGIAIISPAAKQPRIIISTYVKRDSIAYSVTSALTLEGRLDEAFGTGGFHWSDASVINNGFTVEDRSERITLYGMHTLDEWDGQPTLYRLDYAGKPALEFNQGQVVHFHTDGKWHHIVEVNGHLVGYGTHPTSYMAVRYDLNGQLDQTFLPPHGYGHFGGALPPEHFESFTQSMAIDAGNQRMLVSGYDITPERLLYSCLVAIPLKPM